MDGLRICTNNPYKYTDPTGKWAVQVGVGGSGGVGGILLGFIGLGAGGGFGLAISHDEELGLEIGYYEQYGSGLYLSTSKPGFSGGLQFAVTPSAKSINELKGISVSVGGETAKQNVGFGLSYSVPVTTQNGLDFNNPTVTVNPPIPWTNYGSKDPAAEIFSTKTEIKTIYQENSGTKSNSQKQQSNYGIQRSHDINSGLSIVREKASNVFSPISQLMNLFFGGGNKK